MSAGVSDQMRYPLGLPAGSVRSILSMMVVGMFCCLFLIPPGEDERTFLPVLNKGYIVIPVYLVGLVGLVFISFLAAQGRSMNRRERRERAPLGLPPWTIRLLLVAALVATFVYKVRTDVEGLVAQVQASLEAYAAHPWHVFYAILGLLAGYVVGHLFQMLFGVDNQNVAYQDFIAWVSIVAMVGMLILVLISLVINVNLHKESPIDLTVFGSVLAGIIAFYFSVRS